METLRSLHWPLIFGLGALGLLRPLAHITNVSDVFGTAATSLTLTAAISLAWILVVGLGRVRHPFLVLVFSGLAYAVYSIVLSGILSPILTGELQGPLAMPFAIIPVLLTNAAWGAVTGLLALALQKLRRIPSARP